MKKILCTTSSFGSLDPEIIAGLEGSGYEVVLNPHKRKLDVDELRELLQMHEPVGMLAGTEPIPGDVLEDADGYLKIVSRVGVGWDNVDHDVAQRLGIKVFRTEGVLNQCVAELTLGMMLSAMRHIALHDREIRAGVWKKHMGHLLSEQVVGIIGYGAIGQRVGELVTAIGAEMIFTDANPDLAGIEGFVSLGELLAKSSIVTLHVSGSGKILGEKEIAACKKGAVIINTARGGLIDETALFAALKENHLGCACLDVFEKEPYEGPLVELENAVLTTHIGSYAEEARVEMERMAVANLLDGLKGLS